MEEETITPEASEPTEEEEVEEELTETEGEVE